MEKNNEVPGEEIKVRFLLNSFEIECHAASLYVVYTPILVFLSCAIPLLEVAIWLRLAGGRKSISWETFSVAITLLGHVSLQL